MTASAKVGRDAGFDSRFGPLVVGLLLVASFVAGLAVAGLDRPAGAVAGVVARPAPSFDFMKFELSEHQAIAPQPAATFDFQSFEISEHQAIRP
jgi:hypothetical protein